MQGTRAGMMAPSAMPPMTAPAGMSTFRMPQGMGTPLMGIGPSAGLNGGAAYGRSGMFAGGTGSGNGYSGGGQGWPASATMTSPGQTAGYANPYAGAYESAAPATSQPRSAAAGPLFGLLNADGGLDWPLALRILPPQTQDLRRLIDACVAKVQRQAADGPVSPALIRQASRYADQLQEILAARADFLPVSADATTDARRFIRKLRDALKTVP
jgi:hypothetical protein